MGCTKRIGELILASMPVRQMLCTSVRFGNVLGSNGSVVPILQEQIKRGGPITITHPEVKRFFMTISEAVSLVLQGSTIGKHGDILVLDMGEPVLITDMARSLVRLSGKSGSDIQIVFTGLREGEKLFEELFYSSEEIFPTAAGKIKRTRSHFMSWRQLQQHLDSLESGMRQDANLRDRMKKVVPEYTFDGVIDFTLALYEEDQKVSGRSVN
jgi:FlaA1/EpsC-like NDP-sugar epimerase